MLSRKQFEALLVKARAGDAGAQFSVGDWLHDRGDKRAAATWIRKAALAGNPSAQVYLGNLVSDDAEALRWYKRGLKQGEDYARANIAVVYRNRGNFRRAMFWFRRAADGGDGDAWVDVGRGYYKGTGVRRDPAYAVACFRRAIASDNITEWSREEAMLCLAAAYREGLGVKRSEAQALKWEARANQDGDHTAVPRLTF